MIKLLIALFYVFKFGKLGGAGLTMLLSLVIYAQLYGWRFAAGFIGLLFCHEMGHWMAAKQRGLPVGAPMFIPFLGAYIEMKGRPVDVETEAYVAYAGPFVGTLAAFACYFYARQTDSHLWLAVSYSGFFLNLFNLLPVSPLDGGRITAILSPRIWLIGAPLMLAMLFYRPSPALIFIAIVALPQLLLAWRFNPSDPANAAYYSASPALKLEYAVMYLGLAALLAVMTYDVHEMLGR